MEQSGQQALSDVQLLETQIPGQQSCLVEVWGWTCPSDLSPGEVTKLGEKDFLPYTRNAEFVGHEDIWQNPQDEEETNEGNSELCGISSEGIKGN